MQSRKIVSAAIWAIGSFGMTLAIMAPSRLDATGPEDAQAVYVSPPSKPVNGMTFALRIAEGTGASQGRPGRLKPGVAPSFEVVATNTTDQNAEASTTIRILASAPAPMASRVMPILESVWSCDQTITLAPKETRTISVSPQAELKPGSNVSIQVAAGQKVAHSLFLSVERPQAPAPKRPVEPAALSVLTTNGLTNAPVGR